MDYGNSGTPGFLERARVHTKTAAIAAALATLGSLAAPQSTEAGVVAPPEPRSSRVDATVTGVPGAFLYEFSVVNTTPSYSAEPLIVNWELPLFAMTDIQAGSIISPAGWTHEFLVTKDATTDYYNNSSGPYGQYKWDYSAASDPLLTGPGGDPGLYGPNPQVFDNPPLILHWYTIDIPASSPANPIAPGESLPGFSFLSSFSSQAAPYLSSWFELPPVSGDPPIPGDVFAFGTPNSPQRMMAQPIPEPSTYMMLAFGLAIVISVARRKRRSA